MVLQVCEQIFAATHHSVHVPVFHLWLLFELPNNWYALRYDSRTCIALLAEIGYFCLMLDISRPIIDVFRTLTFWNIARKQLDVKG